MRRNYYGKIEAILGFGEVVRVVSGDVVDHDCAVSDVDLVSRQSDYTLDDLFGARLLRFEYDDVAAFGAFKEEIGLSV